MLKALKNLRNRKMFVPSLAVMFALLVAGSAFALTAPANTDIMYPVYNLLVNEMINKGVTYLVGFIGLCVAAYFIMQQRIIPGLFSIIGAIMFFSAGAITTAFGLIF
ncbi:hypothetical protein [Pelobacter propionicus]|jgi:hypothetical protein|uniref:Conjugal transfer protein TrbC n=1 Tax=Pelobacter propionicus (strain DSM 2379 / NBRC 103807 / OttBd1) TaxID=338966 RepID=A0R7R4_PELPD|nr:hypothetical protein [Pelobacter propionicus]ABL01372.1 hypothetical protein Ppro_3783 [Pelobacter propionicus DSM 2379]